MKELKDLKRQRNALKANLNKIKNPNERRLVEDSLKKLDALIEKNRINSE